MLASAVPTQAVWSRCRNQPVCHSHEFRAWVSGAKKGSRTSDWGDYTVEVKVRPLSFADMAGVVFRYRTNRHYYLFAVTGGNKARLVVRLPLEKTFRAAEWRELGSVAFSYHTSRY